MVMLSKTSKLVCFGLSLGVSLHIKYFLLDQENSVLVLYIFILPFYVPLHGRGYKTDPCRNPLQTLSVDFLDVI